MERFFRADGLIIDDNPIVVVKRTNLPFIGATWRPFVSSAVNTRDGLVWHLSEEAMRNRLSIRHSVGLRLQEIEIEEFIPLFRRFHDVEIVFARHERQPW
jgi:hypothetical protein